MAQDEATRVEGFRVLLDDFKKFSGHRVERPRTFMDIAGIPHSEDACSNVLAFYMDPEESHGLGILVLDALANAANITAADEGVGGNVSVDCEVGTDAGKRIDILITSDDHAIVIENKIHAPADNPFDDYAAHLDKIARDRAKHKLLLTLNQSSAGRESGFTNLTYEDFVGEIRSLLGSYVSSADTRHLTMFLDFLNTLENLQRGTRMDKEFVKFLAERGNDVENLFTDFEHFKNELSEKVKGLKSLIDAENHHPGVIGERAVRKAMLSFQLHHIIDVAGDWSFSMSTAVGPRGWGIEFFVGRKSEHPKLRGLLQNREIPFEERGERFIHPAHFDYDEDLNEIKPVLQDLINKLAKSREQEE
jgi:hypothetical protein